MWFNPIIKNLLRSPLHGFVSKNMMLITYTGWKSGKTYTVPVNYYRVQGNTGEYIATTSKRDRVWWRSLRGGAGVEARLQGRDYRAHANVLEDGKYVVQHLVVLFQQHPDLVKYYQIGIDPLGAPDPKDIEILAETSVCIQMVIDI